MEKKCLARLTNWDKTSCRLAPCMTASRVMVCKNVPMNASPLCQKCMERPLDGKYQSRMMHGLLTEPIPEGSKLYGGPWYWLQVDKHGDPKEKEWLSSAIESQRVAEEWCGAGAWKVQRMSAKDVQMASEEKARRRGKGGEKEKAKANANAKADANANAKKHLQTHTIATRLVYKESIDAPVMMQTDSYTLRKEVYGDMEVFISQNGMVFESDDGEPGELIARYVKGEFVDLD
jgi:hypothetical protein